MFVSVEIWENCQSNVTRNAMFVKTVSTPDLLFSAYRREEVVMTRHCALNTRDMRNAPQHVYVRESV